MDSILIILAVSLALASVLNIIFDKFSISHIIGYIITGTIISTVFTIDSGAEGHNALDLIGEFGIVFLMFTIGLEMSFAKLHKLKYLIFFNGFMQVAICSISIFCLAHFAFSVDVTSSIIIALAFSLSSTAIVLPYLKKSKDIITPYGEKSVAVLIFQDIAVIPILLLISFLADDSLPLSDILFKTALYGSIIIVFMFTIGKRVIAWLLHFSSKAQMEELFLGSVFTIVLGTSLIAHSFGFSYSLGAFIAGMIIAETKYHVKVENDISSYKDLLLGAFFFSIGTKIDVSYFASNFFIVLSLLVLVMLIKAFIIFFLIRRKSNKSESVKSAIALCQIGEFSFAIFTLAGNQGVISVELQSSLILITVLSMIVTPFMVNNIYKLAAYFADDFFESDKITPVESTDHTIVCGFEILGKIVAKKLEENDVKFYIISDNLQHVLVARERGYIAYFGHLDNLAVLDSLKVKESQSVILTLDSIVSIQVICEAVLNYYPAANIITKVYTLKEKAALDKFKINSLIHARNEIATLLVNESISGSVIEEN
jgi:CPA2 family monovalent cation:H+ antiporter-2